MYFPYSFGDYFISFLLSNRKYKGKNNSRGGLGKAIIVHSGIDDYTSQPSGNAGSRIGCEQIVKNNFQLCIKHY
jgi:Cu/Zn superoxide dismutase